MIAKHRSMIALVLAVLALAVLGACGAGDEEESATEASAEREAQIAQLEERREELVAQRGEIEQMEERLAAAEAGELEGEEVDPAALGQEIEAAEKELVAASDLLMTDVVEFINADPPARGEPVGPLNRRALDIKADEELVVAQEYIDEGGDYGRAIRIYDEILALDPENQAALDAKAEAEGLRYMNDERFAQVTKGMTRDQVTELLGPPFYRNIKEYPDRGVILWLYPKSAGGKNSAGVYFRQRDGRYESYRMEANLTGGEEEPTA